MVDVLQKYLKDYKILFAFISFVTLVIMIYLSSNYGIIEDARVHNEHGKRLLEYFQGKSDLAALSPLNENGKLINVSGNLEREKQGMNSFGGFFDLLSNFLYQYFGFSGIYEFRNVLSSIFGFLLFLFCGLIGKELKDWKTGIVVFVFVALCPLLFGHSMYNPKDIPFAAFYIFSAYHCLLLFKEFPKVPLKRALFLVLNISILINIRLIGLLFLFYLFVILFLWGLLRILQGKRKSFIIEKGFMIPFVKVLFLAILSYLCVGLFWPYLQHHNLFIEPLKLLYAIKDFKGFVALQLFEGSYSQSFSMPWYYSVKLLLLFTLPIFILLGLLISPYLFFKESKQNIFSFIFLLFLSLFPLVIIILTKGNDYDNARQFLFIIPPLAIISALVWLKCIRFFKNDMLRLGSKIILIILMIFPLRFMLVNSSLISAYFNPIAGGVIGAFGKYEIDYWGVSIKPAIDWISANTKATKSKPINVRMFYGDQLKARYFLDKYENLRYVIGSNKSINWDYSLVLLTEAKFNPNILKNWPPKNTVHQVEVDGVGICAIVKNNKKEKLLARKSIPITLNDHINLSLDFYNKNQFVDAVKVLKKALDIDKSNYIVYSNLCASYNSLMMYKEAEKYGLKALSLVPNKKDNLVNSNLGYSKKGIKTFKKEKLSENELLKLGFNYHTLGYFEKCIEINNEILRRNSKSKVAYNNICSSYCNLKKYDKAIEACEKSLDIDNKFQLAINNLNWAKSLKNKSKK